MWNKYRKSLRVSIAAIGIAHAVWAALYRRRGSVSSLIFVFHNAAVDSWTLKLFQLEISDNLK